MGFLDSVGSFFGSAVGGPIGSILGGIGGGLVQGKESLSQGRRLAEHQRNLDLELMKAQFGYNKNMFNMSKDLYSNMHQIQMEDLKRAGLNPILGISRGIGGGSPPSAQGVSMSGVGLPSPGVSPGDIVGSGLGALKGLLEGKRTKSGVDLDRAQAELARATGTNMDQKSRLNFVQAQHEWLKRSLTEAQTRLTQKNIRKEELFMYRREFTSSFFKNVLSTIDKIDKNFSYKVNKKLLKNWSDKFFNEVWENVIGPARPAY